MASLLRDMQFSRLHRVTLLPCTLSSWLCLQLFLHLVLIQSGMLLAVMGFRLESISVPPSGIRGSSVMLGCEFRIDNENDKLYSLKWFKDENEFFRYTPRGPTPITIFKLPGVHVDSADYRPLNANRILFRLKNLRLSSGGVYKCEISADAPTFKTLSKESNFSVIVLPDIPKPRLKFPQYGQLGDRIRGNCSFTRSYPPAKLTFYVNGVKANDSDDVKVKLYEPRIDGVIDEYNLGDQGYTGMSSGSSNDIRKQYQYQQPSSTSSHSSSSSLYNGRSNQRLQESSQNMGGVHIDHSSVDLHSNNNNKNIVEPKRNTFTSIAGIEFRLDRQHFHRAGQVLTIRCVAAVVDKEWDIQTNITQNNYQAPQLSTAGQNRYSSSGAAEYYILPVFSFPNLPFLTKTVKWAILWIFAWVCFLC